MITITWTDQVTRNGTEHYKIGTYYNDGVEAGIVEQPTDADGNLTITEEALVSMLEITLSL